MKNVLLIHHQEAQHISGGAPQLAGNIDFTNIPIWDGIIPVPEQLYRKFFTGFHL